MCFGGIAENENVSREQRRRGFLLTDPYFLGGKSCCLTSLPALDRGMAAEIAAAREAYRRDEVREARFGLSRSAQMC